MTYANTTFTVPLSLANQDIMDIAVAIETTLKKLGVNPTIADGCVRITVGPYVTTSLE